MRQALQLETHWAFDFVVNIMSSSSDVWSKAEVHSVVCECHLGGLFGESASTQLSKVQILADLQHESRYRRVKYVVADAVSNIG